MALITETRKMLAALEEIKEAQTFLLDTFATEIEMSEQEYVDIDVIQGQRRLAAFVSPLAESKISLRVDGTTQSFKPPYIKIKRPIQPKDLTKRLPGEDPYNPRSLQAKLTWLQNRDLADMRDQVKRREEWMLAQQLTTGAVTCTGDGISATLTLPMLATHELVQTDLVANGWDQSGTKKLRDLRELSRVVSQDSGLAADMVIMGETAFNLFFEDTAIQTLLDNRRINITEGGEVTSFGPSVGARFHGRVAGLDLFTYDEWFIDPDTLVEGPMIPDKKIVVASRALRGVRKYGAIEDMDALVAADYFPKAWSVPDPSVMFNQVQSAPLPLIVQVNGFAYAQVIA